MITKVSQSVIITYDRYTHPSIHPYTHTRTQSPPPPQKKVVTSSVAPQGSRAWVEACLASIGKALPPSKGSKKGKGRKAGAGAEDVVVVFDDTKPTPEYAAAWCVGRGYLDGSRGAKRTDTTRPLTRPVLTAHTHTVI